MASPTGTARIPTQGSWRPLVTTSVAAPVARDARAWGQDRRGRLDGEAAHHRLAGRDAAEDAAGMVRQETRRARVAGPHLVGVLLAPQGRGGETVADLDALHGIDRHQRRREIGVELAVDRRAEARRHALGHDLDHGADRGAVLAHAVEIALVEGRGLGVGAEERIASNLVPVPVRPVDRVRAHLHEGAADRDARRRPCGRWRPPRRAPRSRAPRSARRRDSRGCRTSRRR